MLDITVNVYASGEKRLLALVPIFSWRLARDSDAPLGADEIITFAMTILRDSRGFSDTEVKSFGYEVHRQRPLEAREQSGIEISNSSLDITERA
jgi:hypothetical protein